MTREACGRKNVVVVAVADEEAALAHGSHQSASRRQGMESPILPSTRCVGLLDEKRGGSKGDGTERRGKERREETKREREKVKRRREDEINGKGKGQQKGREAEDYEYTE